MSRRTRIKRNIRKQKFSVSHHTEYSTSLSYFPKSYSLFGTEINFPVNILQFYKNNEINFAGTIDEYMEKQKQVQIDYQNLKNAYLSLKGQVYQQASVRVNLLLFFISIICFCWEMAFKVNEYRNKFYTKYNFKDYERLGEIIRKVHNAETLVINFQDNDLTIQKIIYLDRILCQTNIKNIVLRNLTYNTGSPDDSFFQRVRQTKGVNFKFIWQKYYLLSQIQNNQNEEQTELLPRHMSV